MSEGEGSSLQHSFTFTFCSSRNRFHHIHMDFIDPLPNCDGYRHCITMKNRFSSWLEAVPLRNVETQTIYRAFTDSWISRFGTPDTLITLFSLLHLTICYRIRLTSYHPTANGLVER